MSDFYDDITKYWLCCGSRVYPHGEETSCIEVKIGHPERVRFGTSQEHFDWFKKINKNDNSSVG